MGIDTKEISPSTSIMIIAPIIAVGVAMAGLFWQQGSYLSSFQNNYLSLREHSEYQQATRRELDAAKTAADQQISYLQKQLDIVTTQLRLQLEEKIKDLQNQIDHLRSDKEQKNR